MPAPLTPTTKCFSHVGLAPSPCHVLLQSFFSLPSHVLLSLVNSTEEGGDTIRQTDRGRHKSLSKGICDYMLICISFIQTKHITAFWSLSTLRTPPRSCKKSHVQIGGASRPSASTWKSNAKQDSSFTCCCEIQGGADLAQNFMPTHICTYSKVWAWMYE